MALNIEDPDKHVNKDSFVPFALGFRPFFLLAGALWDPKPMGDINLAVAAALFYQSIVTAAFGFVAWNTMLKRYGASTLHAFVFIMPVAGVVFSGLILGEPITSNLVIALFFIAVGILLVHVNPKKPTFSFLLGRGL